MQIVVGREIPQFGTIFIGRVQTRWTPWHPADNWQIGKSYPPSFIFLISPGFLLEEKEGGDNIPAKSWQLIFKGNNVLLKV